MLTTVTTLGLIGVGKWGKNYLTTADNFADLQIKYICARHSASMEGFSDKYLRTTSVSELLKNEDLNGVIVSTPPDSHFEIVKELLANNLDVLVEKPLTLDLKEAEELMVLSRQSQSKVMVGHIFLFNPAFQKAKQLLPQIGQLKEIVFQGLGTLTREYSVIWDWGPHPISICLDLLGQDPDKYDVKVIERAETGLVSDAEIDLTFNSGVKARIKINCQPEPRVRTLQLVGENGVITLDDTNQEGHKLRLKITGQSESYPSYDAESPLTRELKAFEQYMNYDIKPCSDLEFGVRVIKILAQISDLCGS